MSGGKPSTKSGCPDPKTDTETAVGSIWRIRGSLYAVQGVSDLYLVDALTGRCSCPAYYFQKGTQSGLRRGVMCKHGHWLSRYLEWKAGLTAVAAARNNLVEAVNRALLALQRGTEATIGSRLYWCIESQDAVQLADTLRQLERELKEDQPDGSRH